MHQKIWGSILRRHAGGNLEMVHSHINVSLSLFLCLKKSIKNKTQLMLFSCVSPCRSLQHPYPQFPHESNETPWVPHRRSEETCRNPDSKHHEQRPSIWFTAGMHFARFLKSGSWFPGCFSCPLITSAYLISKFRNCFKKKQKNIHHNHYQKPKTKGKFKQK